MGMGYTRRYTQLKKRSWRLSVHCIFMKAMIVHYKLIFLTFNEYLKYKGFNLLSLQDECRMERRSNKIDELKCNIIPSFINWFSKQTIESKEH